MLHVIPTEWSEVNGQEKAKPCFNLDSRGFFSWSRLVVSVLHRDFISQTVGSSLFVENI